MYYNYCLFVSLTILLILFNLLVLTIYKYDIYEQFFYCTCIFKYFDESHRNVTFRGSESAVLLHSDSLRSLIFTPSSPHLMYLVRKLVLDAIANVASEKPLITCISGLWKDKHAGFPLQELIAVPIFGVLILQDFWGRFAKRNVSPKIESMLSALRTLENKLWVGIS